MSARADGEEGMPSFAEIDENGDGQISPEEWVAFGDEASPARPRRAAAG
jgi:hypothetical protein